MKPIFVIGSARSGTSILVGALINGARIPGFLEGHFLPLAGLLIADIERYYHWKRGLMEEEQTMLASIPLAAVRQDVLEVFRRRAEALAGNSCWVDKSPDARMIRGAPLMREIWPEARFVFAKRRGMENVASRMRKFPHVDFDGHCKLWAESMEAWLGVREELAECSIEIEQRDIALDPSGTAERLCRFLGLSPQQQSAVAKIFKGRRPERTGGGESQCAPSIEDMGWNTEQLASFHKHCDPAFSAFGYSYGSEYATSARDCTPGKHVRAGG